MDNKQKYNNRHKLINGVNYKLCKGCENWFVLNDINFRVQPSATDGFSERCRECQTQYNHESYMKNRERQIENARKRQLENHEEYKEYIKQYRKKRYQEDEVLRQREKDNGKRQREIGYQSEWRKMNPDKCKIYSDKHRDHDVTKSEEKAMLKVFNYSCAYCGITLQQHKIKYKEKLHNDHVDDDGYNDLRNDVPACKGCNCSKHTNNMEEWYEKQDFYTEERYNKIIWWITEGYQDYIEEKPPYKITRSRINRENGIYYYVFELWSVDDKRNMIECIAVSRKKNGLKKYIEII